MKSIVFVKEIVKTTFGKLSIKKIMEKYNLSLTDYNTKIYNSIGDKTISLKKAIHNLKINEKLYLIGLDKEKININLKDLNIIKNIIKTSNHRIANFALLKDKHFFFNENKTAFIMYGDYNNTLITLGGVIGLQKKDFSLLSDFNKFAKQNNKKVIFYDVDDMYLNNFKTGGLTVFKIGEEALIPLKGLLEGKHWSTMRSTINRLDKNGFSFEIIDSPDNSLLKKLRIISDNWLKIKNVKEKEFSMGCFDEEYLKLFSIIIIRKNDKICAFANILNSTEDLSVDLIRYIPDFENGLMDYLFLKLMIWAKNNGYSYFNMGMAPLSGLEYEKKGSIWTKAMIIIYSYGEHFYNFKGIRKYKNKFSPVWKPRYLVMHKKMLIPIALLKIASLISGGIKYIFFTNLKS